MRATEKRDKSSLRRNAPRRSRSARTPRPPETQIQDSAALPEEVVAAFPNLSGARLGDEVWVTLTWAPPVDPNSELVNSAIEIIRPLKDEEASVRAFVAFSIRLDRMARRPKPPPKKILENLKRASQKTAKLLAKLPARFRDQLLRDSPDPSDSMEVDDQGLRLRVPQHPNRTPRLERLRTELDSLANKIIYPSKKTGPKPDDVKLNAARAAYDTLTQFAPVQPTTTAAGPFYELASVYYEAVTGRRGVDMEYSCRKFLNTPALR